MRIEDVVLEALVKWWREQPNTAVAHGPNLISPSILTTYRKRNYDLNDLAREITFELERNS